MAEMHRRRRIPGAIDIKVKGFPYGFNNLRYWIKIENVNPLLDYSPSNLTATLYTGGGISYSSNAQNGVPAANIAGSVYNINLSEESQSHTLIAVIAPTSTSQNTGQYLLDVETGRLIFAHCCWTGSNNQVGYYDGTAWRTIAAATTGWQILTWILTSGGNGEVFRNGSSLGTGSYVAKAISGSVSLFGAHISTTNPKMTGQFGELLYFNKALSSGERNEIESYLNKKWAIY